MSTVLPSSDGHDDPGEPLVGLEPIYDYFRSGEKTRDRFAIGTEHEKFGFLRRGHEPLPYEGPSGIESILHQIADDDSDDQGAWRRVDEAGRTIALARGRATISLEPGGQLELSGAPLKTLHETCREVGEHLELLKLASLPRGVGFIGMGFHPTASWASIPSVPKGRYAIMERYMPTRGHRGLDMMKRTCTVQANFDYESEADMALTMRTAMLIAPLVTPLFANSPLREGAPSGVLSERTLVWADTDPDRSGFLDVTLKPGFGYEQWIEYVLDVPMYFIRRDGIHHDFAGASFREFLRSGLGGFRATLRDFEDHLTTVFTEVRLKKFLEVRSADCGPWSRICALPALYKGVLYDERARTEAAALLDGATAAELFRLQQDAAVQGFDARFRGHTIHALCQSLVDISRAGLLRIAERDQIPDETAYLRPLITVVEERRTFAEKLLDKLRFEWDGNLDRLWSELEFFAED
ncbi:MAG: glutamate--cysteine ligase [Myxococcota bacterium]